MSFKSQKIFSNYNFSEEERHPCKDYRFECAHFIDDDDIFEVYKVDGNGAKKLFIAPECNEKEFFQFIKNNLLIELGDKGVVSGGHSVINLADKYTCGKSVLNSTHLAMKLIALMKKEKGVDYDYLVQFNDLYIEHDTTRANVNFINKYRELMFNPFIIPVAINQILDECSKHLNREITLNYCTTKNLADKFKRYIKKRKLTDNRFFAEKMDVGTNWYYNLHEEKVLILHNDKPNCVAGNAAMLRDIRYEIGNNTQHDKYNSYLGIFPRCSRNNVLNGCAIAYNLFPKFDLVTYIIFYGDGCN